MIHQMFIDIKPGEYYHRDTYERLYDWDTLKGLVDSGDLAYLKRHPSFQRDYDEWTKETIKHEGPMVNILLRRLGWNNIPAGSNDTDVGGITKLEYFTADIQDELVRVVINDWPYSGLYSKLTAMMDPLTTASSAPGRHSLHHMVPSTIHT